MRIRSFLRDAKGASAVELALVTPMLLILLLGLFEFGMAVNEKSKVTAAARAGAQLALTGTTDTATITNAVTAATGLTPADLTVNISTFCECQDGTSVQCNGTCPVGTVRTFVTVDVSKPYEINMNVPYIDSTITLSGSATVRTN
jgi:Flp pilus assembly protein TadG